MEGRSGDRGGVGEVEEEIRCARELGVAFDPTCTIRSDWIAVPGKEAVGKWLSQTSARLDLQWVKDLWLWTYLSRTASSDSTKSKKISLLKCLTPGRRHGIGLEKGWWSEGGPRLAEGKTHAVS